MAVIAVCISANPILQEAVATDSQVDALESVVRVSRSPQNNNNNNNGGGGANNNNNNNGRR